MAYILYHMAKRDIYDPDLIMKFEEEMVSIQSTSMTSRHAMGAVFGYFRLNQGSMKGL